MLSTNVLSLLSPALMAAPWAKQLEAACKEASKKIEKKAKSTLAEKLTEKVVGDLICTEVGKLEKHAAKATTTITKKEVQKQAKAMEKDIKKKDPSSAEALKLTGVRDEMLQAQNETKALLMGKPAKLRKPLGGGINVPFNVRVLTKDKVELNISGFIGVDHRMIPKGELPFSYGVIEISGRF